MFPLGIKLLTKGMILFSSRGLLRLSFDICRGMVSRLLIPLVSLFNSSLLVKNLNNLKLSLSLRLNLTKWMMDVISPYFLVIRLNSLLTSSLMFSRQMDNLIQISSKLCRTMFLWLSLICLLLRHLILNLITISLLVFLVQSLLNLFLLVLRVKLLLLTAMMVLSLQFNKVNLI